MTTHLNMALQGGGAHGAYTWGVLDRLLEETDIEFAAISATSAGALNAVALKAGWVHGGREGARANLDWLWSQVSAIDDDLVHGWLRYVSPAILSHMIEHSPSYSLADAASRLLSPYDFDPLWQNPLEPLVRQLHFEDMAISDGPKLFVCTTNVRTGKIRIFSGAEIGVKAILASACLPTLFQAVEIDDPLSGRTEVYWDGGYTGNPALFPLFDPALPDDIIIVNINPLEREEVPRSARQIQNRINEISFNSSLLRELRAIAFVQRLLDEGAISPGRMKRVLIHMIADDALMTQLSVATKLVPTRRIMRELMSAGRTAADAFLKDNRRALNRFGTVDLSRLLN